jgi:two-component system, cell cycle sensor histidine kinase PleC
MTKFRPSAKRTKRPRASNGEAAPGAERELVEALRAACDEARAANRAKTTFLASVSHELRTPLNAIIGFAEMIAREQLGKIEDQRYPGYAADIVQGARRLQHILSDILDMARLESGRMDVQRANLTLAEIVEETVAMIGERTPAAVPPLKIDLAENLPVLWTDRGRLRQILLNLLSNALSFTDATGCVEIVGRLSPGGDVEIAVSDSGRGMSPAEIKRAVTRFGHVEEELARKHQGIGLGLPLAKSLTELLGGAMRIVSAPGEGTTITLSFPPDSIRETAIVWQPPPDRMAERKQRHLANGG